MQNFPQGIGFTLVRNNLIKYIYILTINLCINLIIVFSEVYLEGENYQKLILVYARGNKELAGSDGVDVGGSLLFGGPMLSTREPQRSSKLSTLRNQSPFSQDFHIYRLRWTPGEKNSLHQIC